MVNAKAAPVTVIDDDLEIATAKYYFKSKSGKVLERVIREPGDLPISIDIFLGKDALSCSRKYFVKYRDTIGETCLIIIG